MSDDSAATGELRYKRVVLKLSGESFSPPGERGISMQQVTQVAEQTFQAAEQGVEVAVVIGGGNIFRGAIDAPTGMNRSVADSVGMLATVINSLMLQESPMRRPSISPRVLYRRLSQSSL